MRDKNLSFIQFSEQIESFIKKKTDSIKILREPVIDNPTFLDDSKFRLRFQTKKLQELRGLAIISYYLPEFLGWKIRYYLTEELRRLNLKDQIRLSTLLINKEVSLAFLYLTQEFSSHDIFGNLIERGCFSLKILKIQRRNQAILRPKRKRGYDDKGTLRSQDRWLPSFDWSLTELQLELERKHDLHKKIQTKLENFLLEKVITLSKKDFLKEKSKKE